MASNIMIFIFSNHTEALSVCSHFVADFTLMLLRDGFLIFKEFYGSSRYTTLHYTVAVQVTLVLPCLASLYQQKLSIHKIKC